MTFFCLLLKNISRPSLKRTSEMVELFSLLANKVRGSKMQVGSTTHPKSSRGSEILSIWTTRWPDSCLRPSLLFWNGLSPIQCYRPALPHSQMHGLWHEPWCPPLPDHHTRSLCKNQPLPPTRAGVPWAYLCPQLHHCLPWEALPDRLWPTPDHRSGVRPSWRASKAFSTILEPLVLYLKFHIYFLPNRTLRREIPADMRPSCARWLPRQTPISCHHRSYNYFN